MPGVCRFWGNYSDDAVYLLSARSLAESQGYRISSLPGEPYQTRDPPLYPALLAIVWRLNRHFPENLSVFGALAGLMVPLTVVAVWWLYRELGLGPWHRLALCTFLALQPVVSPLGTHPLSELPFVALVFVTLALAERASRQPDGCRWAALAGGAARWLRLLALALVVVLMVYNVARVHHRVILYARRHGMRAQLTPVASYHNDTASVHRFLLSLDDCARQRGLNYILLTARDSFLIEGPEDAPAVVRAALRERGA